MGGREKLSEASKNVESAYRKIVDGELIKAADRQLYVVERMRRAEHCLADAASSQGKSLDSDVAAIQTSCKSLEGLVNEVVAASSDVLQLLRDIDGLIPSSDRLLTSGHSHQNHYAHLYALMSEAPIVPPDRSSVGSSQASLALTSAKADSPSRSVPTGVRQKLQDLALRR